MADANPAAKRVCSTAPVTEESDLLVVTQKGSTLKDILFASRTEMDNSSCAPVYGSVKQTLSLPTAQE